MRVWSVFLLALCLLASPALAGNARSVNDARLPLSAIPILEEAALVANSENAVRTLVRADEVVGVSQIRALAGHTDFEEQWAFVPSMGLWIEIGRNESVSELDSEVELDVDYLSEIVSLYRSVTVFHFHPAGFYRRVWQSELYPSDFPARAIDRGKLQPVGFALPSPNDVISSIELSRLLWAKDPAARVTYSVVSPHGVVTYGPTGPGLKTIAYNWGNPRAADARSIVTRIAIRRMPFNIASTIAALDSPTIGEVIRALCGQASDENYRITFTPF